MRSFEAMGTRFECVLASFDRAASPTERAAVAEAVEQLVTDWHSRLTVFDPASTVSRVNAQGAQRPVTLERDLYDLLQRCAHYTDDTHGRFDIAVGSLMRRAGFRGEPAGSDASAGTWGNQWVRLDPRARSVWFARPGVSIDLGAIAKGFVLDLAREELLDLGVTSALIHGGTSSVLAIGSTPDGTPWRIRAIAEDPAAPVIELCDASLSVSAPSGREVNGRGHIMDPITGDSASALNAACVFGPSAEICEAWSTALAVDPSLASDMPSGYGAHLRTAGGWSSPTEPRICSNCSC
ncbi:MAG: FAD:protein FMN transferase [Phycisphaerales bacterium]